MEMNCKCVKLVRVGLLSLWLTDEEFRAECVKTWMAVNSSLLKCVCGKNYNL